MGMEPYAALDYGFVVEATEQLNTRLVALYNEVFPNYPVEHDNYETPELLWLILKKRWPSLAASAYGDEANTRFVVRVARLYHAAAGWESVLLNTAPGEPTLDEMHELVEAAAALGAPTGKIGWVLSADYR